MTPDWLLIGAIVAGILAVVELGYTRARDIMAWATLVLCLTIVIVRVS